MFEEITAIRLFHAKFSVNSDNAFIISVFPLSYSFFVDDIVFLFVFSRLFVYACYFVCLHSAGAITTLVLALAWECFAYLLFVFVEAFLREPS